MILSSCRTWPEEVAIINERKEAMNRILANNKCDHQTFRFYHKKLDFEQQLLGLNQQKCIKKIRISETKTNGVLAHQTLSPKLHQQTREFGKPSF